MNVDFSDVTVVIPFRRDTSERVDNLRATLRYFRERFVNHEIFVFESAPAPSAEFAGSEPGVRYRFRQDDAPLFDRIALLNQGFLESSRPFVSPYDVDVLAEPRAFAALLSQMRSHPKLTYAIPYNGVCLDIGGPLKTAFLERLDFSLLPRLDQAVAGASYADMAVCMNAGSCGGAPLVRREQMIRLGGYNRKFRGWGVEDHEIVHRLVAMGRQTASLPGFNLYHLTHARGPNSSAANPFFKQNQDEFARIKRMTKDELVEYIRDELKPI